MLFCAGRGTAETRPSRETGHARSIELPAAELSASGLKGSAGTACRSRNLSLCLGTPAELGKKIARAPVPSKRFPVRVPNPRRRSVACQCGNLLSCVRRVRDTPLSPRYGAVPSAPWGAMLFLLPHFSRKTELTITTTEPALWTNAPATGFNIPPTASMMAMKFRACLLYTSPSPRD